MNNDVFGNTMKNVRRYRDIKLVTNEARSIMYYQNQTIIQKKILKIYWP